MRRKNIWLKKVLAVSVCAAMAFQPAVTFAEDFPEESVQEAPGKWMKKPRSEMQR